MKQKTEAPLCPRADIGGQAVLDGVMMKSPDAIAVAVRRSNGDIVVKRESYEAPAKKHKWMGLPFIRGSVNMVQMLGIGMRVLDDSMKMSGEDAAQEQPSKFDQWLADRLGKNVDKVVMGMAVVLAVALSIGLFVLLPNLVILLFPREATGSTLLIKNLVSGLVRILILTGYITLVGQVPDMRRTFQYHGSEHKTVYCHEHDLPLTPENAQQFTTLHPRCGTSFLILTFILSILFYSVIDVLVLQLTGFDLGAHYLLRVLSRILLLPCVAGISYEALKALAHHEGPLVRALRWPGLQMQRLTTRQPSDAQCEVAIASMNAALHGLPEGEKTPEGWVILHPAQA
ncbi:MAG: DUF1385 domain-containing protein [Clostridiales bacterium]|nr:DUF1385 domain-containing protein [Clostridiales bacterium]